MIGDKCSYCDGHNDLVKHKNVIRFSQRTVVFPRTPICAKCLCSVSQNRIPVTSTKQDLDCVKMIDYIKSAADGLSKKTPLHKIKQFCDELDKLAEIKKLAVFEFEAKAREAEQAAKKIEWLRSSIDEATFVLTRKTKLSYEFCRKVANKCCSDLETRNAVFSRDGGKCVQCGIDENLSVDHIKSVKLGGANDLDNLQTLCLPCNVKKGWKIEGRRLRPKQEAAL